MHSQITIVFYFIRKLYITFVVRHVARLPSIENIAVGKNIDRQVRLCDTLNHSILFSNHLMEQCVRPCKYYNESRIPI